MISTTDRRTRQYRVTHIPTGIVTVVQAPANGNYTSVAAKAGFRHPLDATVAVVPIGQEIPLPWGGAVQLILKPRHSKEHQL